MTNKKICKFPAKLKKTIYLLAATGLAFQATNHSDFLPEKITASVDGIVRSSRAISTFASTVADYKYSLYGLTTASEDYRRKLSEVHLRSAKRILKLCEINKGFYIKAGQFVAAVRQVPKEYSSTLSSLQDQAVPFHFKAIKEVLISNLGQDFSEIFLSLDEQPIAAASIAQVHHAVLRDHQEVAIKVQYPGIENKMRLDTTIMSFLSKAVAWFFPEYRFEWLISEFAGGISLELDFTQEARNAIKTAENFKNNDIVRVPNVFWDLTTKHILTMEFCKGCKVAKALVEVFAEMMFVHGFIHGDLHPGNILVSPKGQNDFTLVLLDHGIYKTLDETFRVEYCQLWKALILLDSKKIYHLGDRFGVGKYSKYFPLIFTGRTIDSKSAVGKGMSVQEKRKLKQELESLKMEDISSFMESLPPDFITILRTDGLLRSVIGKLGAPQQIRLLAYAKYALYGLSPKLSPKSDSAEGFFNRFKTITSYLHLRLVLESLELLSWMHKFKQFLHLLHRKVSSTMRSVFQ
ncbi:aarF domain-containing protein kinase 1 isoform X2 [Mangifera indica]|uniref:aarF domain-containing protein kinase 1 isoform X2 n=1 Tax=Mangifera indica TaxID=29780 RepID=UPI001CFA0798|nr:aarF domain-containing protein kinase 1 isoform X2 [Mangifera indica]